MLPNQDLSRKQPVSVSIRAPIHVTHAVTPNSSPQPSPVVTDLTQEVFARFQAHIGKGKVLPGMTQKIQLIEEDLDEINGLVELAAEGRMEDLASFAKKMKKFEKALIDLEKEAGKEIVPARVANMRTKVHGYLEWNKVRKKLFAVSDNLHKALESFNGSWTDPHNLMGQAPLDYGLKDYAGAMAHGNVLLTFYEAHKAKLTNPTFKQLFTVQIKEMLHALVVTQQTFREEQLDVMQFQVKDAKEAYRAAVGDLAKCTNLRSLFEGHQRVQEALAKVRQIEVKLQTAVDAAIALAEQFKSHAFTEDEVVLAKEYDQFRQRLIDDKKALGKLLGECAISQSEIQRIAQQMSGQILAQTKNPHLIKILAESFVTKDWQVDKSNENQVLQLTKELAFITTVEESLPASTQKNILKGIKDRACALLGIPPSTSSREIYSQALAKEAQQADAAMRKEWEARQEELLAEQEKEGLSERTKMAVHGLFVAMQVGARFEQIYQQGELTLAKGKALLARHESDVPKNVEKAAALIGTVLSDKSLKDMTDQQFANLTKPFARWGTNGQELLAKFRSGELPLPKGTDEIQNLMTVFKLSNLTAPAGPFASKSFSDWLELFITPQGEEVPVASETASPEAPAPAAEPVQPVLQPIRLTARTSTDPNARIVKQMPVPPVQEEDVIDLDTADALPAKPTPKDDVIELDTAQALHVHPDQTSAAARTHNIFLLSAAKAFLGWAAGVTTASAQTAKGKMPSKTPQELTEERDLFLQHALLESPQLQVDDRLLQHILGSYFGGGTGLEGYNPIKMIQHVNAIISNLIHSLEANPLCRSDEQRLLCETIMGKEPVLEEGQLVTLFKDIAYLMRQSQDITEALHSKNYENFRTEMTRLVGNRERFFFQGGWVNKNSGHSIVTEAEPQKNGKYTIRIYNRGEGAEYYSRTDIEAQEQMLSLTELVDVEPENLLNPLFLGILVQFEDPPSGDDWQPKEYYETTLRLLKGKLSSKVYTGDALMERLDVGHCTFLSLTGLFSYYLGSNVRYQRLEHWIQLKTFHDYYTQNKDRLATDEQALNLLKSSLKQYDMNLRRAASSGLVSGPALIEANALSEKVWATIRHADAAKQEKESRAVTSSAIVAQPNVPFSHVTRLLFPDEVSLKENLSGEYVEIDTTHWVYRPETFFADVQALLPKLIEAREKGLEIIEKEAIKEFVLKIDLKWIEGPMEEWASAPTAFWKHLTTEQANEMGQYLSRLGMEFVWSCHADQSQKEQRLFADVSVLIKLLALRVMLEQYHPAMEHHFIPMLVSKLMKLFLNNRMVNSYTYDPGWAEERSLLSIFFENLDENRASISKWIAFLPESSSMKESQIGSEIEFAMAWLQRPEIRSLIDNDPRYTILRTMTPFDQASFVSADERYLSGESKLYRTWVEMGLFDLPISLEKNPHIEDGLIIKGRLSLLPSFFFEIQNLKTALNLMMHNSFDHNRLKVYDWQTLVSFQDQVRRIISRGRDNSWYVQYVIFSVRVKDGEYGKSIEEFVAAANGQMPAKFNPLYKEDGDRFKKLGLPDYKSHSSYRYRLPPHQRLIHSPQQLGADLPFHRTQEILTISSVDFLQGREVFDEYLRYTQALTTHEGFELLSRLTVEGDSLIKEFRNHPVETLAYAKKIAQEHRNNYLLSLRFDDMTTALRELHFNQVYARAFLYVQKKYPESIPSGVQNPFMDSTAELLKLLNHFQLSKKERLLALGELIRSYKSKDKLTSDDVLNLIWSKIVFDWEFLELTDPLWGADKEEDRRDTLVFLRQQVQEVLENPGQRDEILNGILQKLYPKMAPCHWEVHGASSCFRSQDDQFVFNVVEGTLREKGGHIRQLPPDIRSNSMLVQLFGENQKLQGVEVSKNHWHFRSPDGQEYQLIPLGNKRYSHDVLFNIQRFLNKEWYRYLAPGGLQLPYQALVQSHHVWIKVDHNQGEAEVLFIDKQNDQVRYRALGKINSIHSEDNAEVEFIIRKTDFTTHSVRQMDAAGEETGLILTNIYDHPGGYAPLLRFEAAGYVNVLQNGQTHEPASIELPRFDLQFTPKKVQGEWRVYSNQFRGFYIAKKQYQAELGDISHYLVLEKNLGQGKIEQIILVPVQPLDSLQEPRLITLTKPKREENKGLMAPQRYVIFDVINHPAFDGTSLSSHQFLPREELRPKTFEGQLLLSMLHLWKRRPEQAFNYLRECSAKDRYCFRNGEQRRAFNQEEQTQLSRLFNLHKETQDTSPESLGISLYAAFLIVRDAKDFSHTDLKNEFLREMIFLLDAYLQKYPQMSKVNLFPRDQYMIVNEALAYDPMIKEDKKLVQKLLAIQERILQHKQKLEGQPHSIIHSARITPFKRSKHTEFKASQRRSFLSLKAPAVTQPTHLLRPQIHALFKELWDAIGEEDYRAVFIRISGIIPPYEYNQDQLKKLVIEALKVAKNSFHSPVERIYAEILLLKLQNRDWTNFSLIDHLAGSHVLFRDLFLGLIKELFPQVNKESFPFLFSEHVSEFYLSYILGQSKIFNNNFTSPEVTIAGELPDVPVVRVQLPLIPLHPSVRGAAPVPDALQVSIVAKPPPFLQQPLVANVDEFIQTLPPTEADKAAAKQRGGELVEIVDIATANDGANHRLAKAKNDLRAFYEEGGGVRGKKEIVSLEKLNALKGQMLDRLQQLEEVIPLNIESILGLANQMPKDPVARSLREASYGADLDRPLSLQELRHLFHTGNMAAFYKRNPFLSKKELHQLFAMIQSNEIQVIYSKLIQQGLKLIAAIKNAHVSQAPGLGTLVDQLSALLAKVRDYDVSKYPAYLELERVLSGLLRSDQVTNLERLDVTKAKPNSDQRLGAVIEMTPGSGKTSVLVPSEAVKNANGKDLAITVISERLIDSQLPEIRSWVGEAYGLRVETLTVDRSDRFGLEELLRFKQRLQEIIQDRSILVITDTTIQSLFLKFIEKVLDGRVVFQAHPNYLERATHETAHETAQEIKTFAEILALLRTSGIPIIDEVDFILDVLKATHFTAGTPRPLKHETIYAIGEVFEYLAGEFFKAGKIHFNFLEGSHGQPFTEDTYRELGQPDFVEAAVNGRLCQTDAELRTFFAEANGDQQSWLREYLNNRPNEQAQRFIDAVPSMRIKNVLAVLKEFITQVFPLIADKIPDEHYGTLSEQERIETGRSDYRVPVPFHGCGDPALHSQFGTYLEQAGIAFMHYLKKGVTDEILFDEMVEIQKSVRSELNRGIIKGWKQSKLYPRFLQLVAGDPNALLFAIREKADVAPFVPLIKSNHRLTISLVAKHVLKQVRIFPEQYQTSGQIYDAIFHLTKGFTGTLSPDSLPDMFYQAFTSKAFEETLDVVWKNSPKEVAVIHAKPAGPTDVKALVHELYIARKGFKGCFADLGGLFRGIDNEVVAREIIHLPIWKEQNPPIEGILFYNKDNEMMVMWVIDGQEAIEPYVPGLKKENLIVYWDQVHTRGSDVKLGATMTTTVSIGSHSTASDHTQADRRLRELDWGQRVDFVVAEEDQRIIAKTLSKATGQTVKTINLKELIQYLLYHEGDKQSDNNYRSLIHKITGLLVNAVIETLTQEQLSAEEIVELIAKTKALYVLEISENPYEEMGQVAVLGEREDVMARTLERFFNSPQMQAFAEVPVLKRRYNIDQIKQAARDLVARNLSKLPARLSISPNYNRQVAVKIELQSQVKTEKETETQTKLKLNIRVRTYDPAITEPRPNLPWSMERLFSKQTFAPALFAEVSNITANEVTGKGLMVVNYRDAFANDPSMEEFAGLVEGMGSLNLMPVYLRDNAKQPIWRPFGTYADSVRHYLIVQDKATGAVQVIDIDQEDAGQIRLLLQEDSKKPWNGTRDVRVVLYKHTSGVENQSSDRIDMDNVWKTPQALRELVMSKFRNGEQQYQPEEIPVLKALIQEKGPEKMYALFYNYILQDLPELFDSDIQQIFESFGLKREWT
jgi:hypothetical protein